jgi:hypothetical protein
VALTVTPLRQELARNELAMTGAYVRGTQPLSDYERDDRDSEKQIRGLKWAIERIRKRQQLQNEKNDRER